MLQRPLDPKLNPQLPLPAVSSSCGLVRARPTREDDPMVPAWSPPSCSAWNQGLLCFFPTGLYITHIVSSSPSGSPFSDILTHSLSLAHIYARFPLYLKKNTLNSVFFFLRYRSPLFYQQPLMPSVSIVSTLSLNLLMKRVGLFAFGVPPPKNG